MKIICYFLFLPLFTNAFIYMNQLDFSRFKTKFHKSYTDKNEETLAYKNFCQNKDIIKKINTEQSSYSVAINELADLDLKSISNTRLNLKISNISFPMNYDLFQSKNNTFISIDWRKKGKIRDVKNQGNCGSCWAFSTIGAIESMIDIHNQIKDPLSEQELVDCSDENFGCSGGWMHEAMYYIKEANGLYKEVDYPYKQKENKECKNLQSLKIKEASRFNVIFVKEESPISLNHALLINPICIAVDANDYGFLFYKDGIYDRPLTDRTSINHAVLLTSYDDQEEIWTIKNSWGTSWGKKGYMNIKKRDEHGVAGMNTYCVFPLKR